MLRLNLPDALRRTLATTHVIENVIGCARELTARVKRWRGGTMLLRWVVAGQRDAQTRFRRIRGYQHLHALPAALQAPATSDLASLKDAA